MYKTVDDIKDKNDVILLIDTFYERLLKDEDIGFIFTDIVRLHFDTHMPIMYSFWSSLLLGDNNYKGNPMHTHINLNQKVPLTSKLFDIWLSHWESTVNQLFVGEIANEAIQKSKNVARLMQYKIQQSENKNQIL